MRGPIAEGPGARWVATVGFDGPPHRVAGTRGPRALATATTLTIVVALVLAAVPVGYLVAAVEGRALLVDAAFAMGFGVVEPDGVAAVGPCVERGGGARYRLMVASCAVSVVAGGATRTAPVDVLFRRTLPSPGPVGRVGGVPAVRWSPGVLADRWAYLLVPLAPFGLAIAFALGWTRQAHRLAGLRGGTVRAVDLLTWQGRPTFAFEGRDGRWSYATASRAMAPLVLDGLRTVGAALVRGRHAALLGHDLAPLELDPARREAVLEQVAELHLRGRARARLPADRQEPPSDAARLARLVEAHDDRTPVARFEAAWRLVWDTADPAVAEGALRVRDDAARALGPKRAHAALQACRRRAAAAEPLAAGPAVVGDG